MAHQDVVKLKNSLRVLFRDRRTKPQLLQALKARLKNFLHLKGTVFQQVISDFIIDRAEQDCEIIMHDEDIADIWGQ